MEQLHNGFTLDTAGDAFPLSTDSMLLGNFVRLPKNAHVLDLGSGSGTLGLLLCAKDKKCAVTGVEIDEKAHAVALQNIDRNQLSSRLSSICADLRTVALPAGHFHVCVSNPPYFSGGPASKLHATARREDHCSTEELFCTAAKALRYGGDFFLVHRPEKLAQLCACGSSNALEPKHLRLVRHKENGPISLILLQCRKGGKPGLKIDECYLFDCNGAPSAQYRSIYHLQED